MKMPIKLDLRTFYGGDRYTFYIRSNDGSTILDSLSIVSTVYTVTSTGVSYLGRPRYTYSGSSNFIGLATSANATQPTYAIGDDFYLNSDADITYYIVEQDGVPYEHIYKDNHKVQVDSAIRDGNGVKIDTNYAKKSELPDVSAKMDKANPTGTGSLSINRKANTTIGSYSSATGNNATASGDCSHAEGSETTASGEDSHAEGYKTIASEIYSHAEGLRTTASGYGSHAEGFYTTANGDYSHAEGIGATTFGNYSHAEGYYTTAQRKSQHVFGEYNVLDTAGTTTTRGNYVEIVGKGTGDNARSNARTLDWSGNEVLAGSQTATSFIKSGGTSSQFLKADGSVDSSSYLTSISSSDVTTALGYTPANASNLGTASTKDTGTSSGNVPVLDTNGKLPSSVVPASAITDTFVVSSESAMLALSSANIGDVAVRTDINKSFILKATPYSTLSNWQELLTPTDAVTSVNGQTGVVSLTASDVGALPSSTVIPTVNNATLSIQLNGSSVSSFTANASSNVTANIKALPNYSITIGSTNGGNPRQVKFVRINYTNFGSESGAYFKLGAMASHGNGSSYTFVEDIFINVNYQGTVYCDVYKYTQQSVTLDGVERKYGDVFWTIDTTNKVVDFYILLGQYSSAQFTPATKIGSTRAITSANGITQLSGSPTYYSSGTKTWATGNSTTYARLSDISNTVIHDDSSAVSESTLLDNYYTKTQSDSRFAGNSSSGIATALGYTPMPQATLLWNNTSPNSAFNSQTLTISSLSNYTWIAIEFKFYAASDVSGQFTTFRRATGTGGFLTVNEENNACARKVTFTSSTQISFSSGSNKWGANNQATAVVPIRIYGLN